MGDLTLVELPNAFRSRFVHFTEVVPGDSSFLYTLRSGSRGAMLSNPVDKTTHESFLSSRLHDPNIRSQERYYTLRHPLSLHRYGAVRITRLDDPIALSWESLVVQRDAPAALGVDAILSVYSLAFLVLGRQKLGPWRVRTSNTHMLRIHERLGFVSSHVNTAGDPEGQYVWLSVRREEFIRDFPRWSRRGYGCFEYPRSWRQSVLEHQ